MADIFRHPTLDAAVLDPNETISHWRILEGREKSQKEINDERLAAWRCKYDASVSLDNWRKYNLHSKQA